MSDKQTGGDTAYPVPCDQSGVRAAHDQYGMTQRQRACIDLRVPESGDEWLDGLIRAGRRAELAGRALAGIFADGSILPQFKADAGRLASTAIGAADALAAELDRREAE